MKANEFIKEHGLEEAMYIVSEFPNDICVCCARSSSSDAFNLNIGDLKRLIESHEFVEKLQGIGAVKSMVQEMRANGIGLMLTSSFEGEWLGCFSKDAFLQIIEDVESCQ